MPRHFYDQKGNKAYRIIGKNGKERDTTIRDAREKKLVPSVTEVIGQIAKGGAFDRWKKRRLLDIVEQYPHWVNKAFDDNGGSDWKDRLIALSEERDSSYSKRGQELHNAFEQYFKGNIQEDDLEFVQPVYDFITKVWPGKYIPELSFAHPLGFGGCMDLVIESDDGIVLIDFKTKEKDELGKDNIYGMDYCIQLSAYQEYLKLKYKDVLMCSNILVSTTKPGLFYSHDWSGIQLDKGFEMFKALLKYWKLANNCDSSFEPHK